MNKPLFSCVIPVKGERPFFGEAIDSLKAQGLGDDLEIIVQDADIEPDAGQSDALNRGLAKASGKWLLWLNADDVLLPNALGKVRDFIERVERVEHVVWIAGNTIYIDRYGNAIGARRDARWRPWFGKHMSVWTGGPSAFFRQELWREYGGFDVGLKFVMDLDLWTRWARMGIRFKSLDDYIWGFRVHDGSSTCKDANKLEIGQEFEKVLRRYNICHERFWRNITRLSSVFDGSRWLKITDSYRFRGRGLLDCAGRMG